MPTTPPATLPLSDATLIANAANAQAGSTVTSPGDVQTEYAAASTGIKALLLLWAAYLETIH